MPSLSAMILAGGRSRRMGTDKALLRLPNGQSLLTQTAQVAQTIAAEVIVVTPWPERYEAILPPTVQLAQEQPHQNGPLGGFSQGWNSIHADWCLVLACDLPQLESEPLGKWWDWIQKQSAAGGADGRGLRMKDRAIASLTQRQSAQTQRQSAQNNHSIKRWEPLCGFYHKNCLQNLHSHLSNASADQKPCRLSFQAWLVSLYVLTYKNLPSSVLFNCNTAEDWAQIASDQREDKVTLT